MRLLLLTTITIFLFLTALFSNNPVFALSCNDFSISPNPVQSGEEFSLRVSSELLKDEGVILFMPDGSQTNFECTQDKCGPVLITIPTQNITPGSYSLEFRYVSLNSCQSYLNLQISEEADNLCSSPGISLISPSTGNENSLFTFQGCLGSDTSGRIVISGGSLSTPRELVVNTPNEDGTFSISRNGFPVGVLSAQLFLGTNTPTGNIKSFTVDSASQDTIGDSCSVSLSCGNGKNRTCTGTFVTNSSGNLVCQYDQTTDCTVCPYCGDNICQQEELDSNSCPSDCRLTEYNPAPYDLCFQVGEENYEACNSCIGEPDNEDRNMWTAFGCIPTSPEGIVANLIRLGLSIAGGIALLFIVFGAFSIATSVGDPQKLQNGQQMITSAVIGILLIVFSVIIMNILGVQILAIPGF